MAPAELERGPHPCLHRDCGHPPSDHTDTPELAGPDEQVVFCVTCRRHETRRAHRWAIWSGRSTYAARRHRFGPAS